MKKISDELREWCNLPQAFSIPCDELYELADRIDREMVELPKDADGNVIHVGDMVRKNTSGKEMIVKELYLLSEQRWVISVGCGLCYGVLEVTHEHDSFERIARELERWGGTVDMQSNGYGKIFERANEFADRIRKLAKEDGNGKGQD